MTVNGDLFDLAVRHQVGLQRVSTATVRKLIALLNRVDADIVAQMQRYDPTEVSGAWSAKRLEKLLEAVRVVNRDAYNTVGKELTADLKALAAYEGVFQASALSSALPIAFDIISPSAEQLFAAVNSRPFQGRILKEWGRDLESGAFAKVRDAIRQGFVEGQTVDQIVRRLVGTRANQFRDGILEINRRSAEAVVRTAINHTANAARQSLYEANADLIGSWRFVATLDAKTSVGCASLDGKTFPIGQGPQPPRHYNCRSSSVPITRSWRELGFDIDELPPGTRASMDGQVPGEMTYNDWLKGQPAEVQDEVLGKTKAALFRDGDLPLDRFVDDGRAMTLDELRHKETEAFARAGLAA
jgi:SPP1 gp7 family putative phage head morphogenesis protein